MEGSWKAHGRLMEGSWRVRGGSMAEGEEHRAVEVAVRDAARRAHVGLSDVACGEVGKVGRDLEMHGRCIEGVLCRSLGCRVR